jgi:ankyrin repeat protein
LDIAVTYHFAEIVQTLLKEGAKTHSGGLQWEYSAFHIIGQKTKSFARYVAHGSESRKAVVRTIHVLRETGGLDINDVDSVGQTPLICAASNLDLQLYMLVALLNAGALASGNFRPEDGNIATLVARTCLDRRYTSKKLTLLPDQVEDINELDIYGFNGLHYCAITDGVNMARILLGVRVTRSITRDVRNLSTMNHHLTDLQAIHFAIGLCHST